MVSLFIFMVRDSFRSVAILSRYDLVSGAGRSAVFIFPSHKKRFLFLFLFFGGLIMSKSQPGGADLLVERNQEEKQMWDLARMVRVPILRGPLKEKKKKMPCDSAALCTT